MERMKNTMGRGKKTDFGNYQPRGKYTTHSDSSKRQKNKRYKRESIKNRNLRKTQQKKNTHICFPNKENV